MATKKINQVSQDDIDAAQDALGQGNAELVRLTESFYNGDGVEWSQVTAQRGVVEYAEAQIERMARAQARYQADVRLNAANTLHDEINSYAFGIGKTLAEQARTYHAERLAFLALAAEHNATVNDFLARAKALDVPVSNGRPVPFTRDGKLALPQNGSGLHAGRRRLSEIDGPTYLERLDTHHDIDAVAESLAGIDAELPDVGEKVFYRGSGGGVFAMDVDPDPEEITRNKLVKLTREQAWGSDDE